MDVINRLKDDLYLKDNDLFLLYDIVKDELCSYFGKFLGSCFYVVFTDGTNESGTEFSYNVLRNLMDASLVPVNASILLLGRKRSNYFLQAVDAFMNSHGYEYNVPFTMGDSGTDTCIVHRNGLLERNGKTDLVFLFQCLFAEE